MNVFTLERIRSALDGLDVTAEVAEGFVAYSAGRAVVPPVGELTFAQPPGDVHIKYGYLRGGETYVIKIASGFYDNPKRGLSSSNGMMLVFDARTGVARAVLADEGHLTDVRTAAAGAIAARHLAPSDIERVGVLGCGIQARMQVEYALRVVGARDVVVWGRDAAAARRYAEALDAPGSQVRVAGTPAEVAAQCNLIVTATPAREPLLAAGDVRPGTHITAMGSDTPGKQELDPAILGRADLVVADSIAQCCERGEIAHALATGAVARGDLVELGHVITGEAPGRTDDRQITVADLTGVAVQDIQIATAVCRALGA